MHRYIPVGVLRTYLGCEMSVPDLNEDNESTSQELETADSSTDLSNLKTRWNLLLQSFKTSQIPFLLVAVFLTLLVAKILVIISVEWMVVEEVIPNGWLYLNPYDASDIEGTPEILLALANRWDSQHFLEIARNGYPIGVESDLLFAFAPVYPLMVAFLSQLVNNLYLSGVVVSNSFYFLSIIAFYKVARLYMDYEKSCLLALVFGIFPIYLAYSTLAYSEAPYLFFTIASWYFFKKEWYLPCSLFMTLSILTRYISLLLVIIYGISILSNLLDKYKEMNSLRRAFDVKLLWFLIPGFCVTIVFLYFQSLTGSFFAAFDAHGYFGDSLTTPFHQFMWFFGGFFVEINPGADPFALMILRYMFTIPFFILTLILFRDDLELGFYGLVFMWFTLSMEGISGVASPRIMLSAWVAFFALKGRMSSALYIVLAVMFFFVGIWVMYQFQLTFFA